MRGGNKGGGEGRGGVIFILSCFFNRDLYGIGTTKVK